MEPTTDTVGDDVTPLDDQASKDAAWEAQVAEAKRHWQAQLAEADRQWEVRRQRLCDITTNTDEHLSHRARCWRLANPSPYAIRHHLGDDGTPQRLMFGQSLLDDCVVTSKPPINVSVGSVARCLHPFHQLLRRSLLALTSSISGF